MYCPHPHRTALSLPSSAISYNLLLSYQLQPHISSHLISGRSSRLRQHLLPHARLLHASCRPTPCCTAPVPQSSTPPCCTAPIPQSGTPPCCTAPVLQSGTTVARVNINTCPNTPRVLGRLQPLHQYRLPPTSQYITPADGHTALTLYCWSYCWSYCLV